MNRAWELGEELLEDSIRGYIDITPWEALLLEVKRTSYRILWVDRELDAAVNKLQVITSETTELDEDRAALNQARKVMREWMAESRNERRHLTRVSKAAIDAGIASALVQQAELDGARIAKVLARAMDVLELTDDQKRRAGQALRLALEEVALDQQVKTADTRRSLEAGALGDADAERIIEGQLADTPERDEDGLRGTETPDFGSDTREDPPEPPGFTNPGDFV